MKLFGNYSLKSTHFLLKKIKVLKRFSPNVFGLTSPFKKKESKKKKKNWANHYLTKLIIKPNQVTIHK